MKYIIAFFVSAYAFQLNAQQLKNGDWQIISSHELSALLQNVNDNYKKINYSFDITHSLYSDHEKATLVEKSKGYSKKYIGNYTGFNNDVFTIQNQQYKVVIDSTEKLVLVSNRDTSYFQIFDHQVNEFITMVSTAKMRNFQKETQLILELNSDYKKISYLVNLNEFNMVTWMEIFFHYNPFSDPLFPNKTTIDQKYLLRLDFSNINLKYKPGVNEFAVEKIIHKQGNKLQLANAYRNYELIDLRLQ